MKIFICILLLSATVFAKNPSVLIKTSLGDITILLNQEKAPVTVANFLKYVKSGFYNKTIFHRVIDNFMIQGGGFSSGMFEKKADAPILNEAGNGLSNLNGTIAMARTNVVNSATAQFFINVSDNSNLNHRDKSASGYGYAVFGKVTKGMSIVNTIKKVKVGRNKHYSNVPVQDIIIKKMIILK